MSSGPTATRGLLALSKVEEFAAWAVAQGYERKPLPNGAPFEVLRLVSPSRKLFVFYKRTRQNISNGTPIHASTDARGEGLIRRWLKERKVAS